VPAHKLVRATTTQGLPKACVPSSLKTSRLLAALGWPEEHLVPDDWRAPGDQNQKLPNFLADAKPMSLPLRRCAFIYSHRCRSCAGLGGKAALQGASSRTVLSIQTLVTMLVKAILRARFPIISRLLAWVHVIENTDTILINNLNFESGLVDQEPHFQLIDAHLNKLQGLLQRHIRLHTNGVILFMTATGTTITTRVPFLVTFHSLSKMDRQNEAAIP
jgi:hypothetical protein